VPFTPSHAVVALAFVRTPLVPAAVAIGAMTPDLPLFVRAGIPGYGVTHDPLWLPVTVAMSLVLLLVWRCVLRPAVRELTPAQIAARLPPSWDRGPRAAAVETFAAGRERIRLSTVAVLVASLAIGVATHIAWDAFTHEGRWGVLLLPGLDEQWGPVTGFKWVQHGSSVLGLLVLAVWAGVWLMHRRPVPYVRSIPAAVRVAWWISLPLCLVVAWTVGLAVLGPLDEHFTVAHLAYRVLPPACAVWGMLTVALALVVPFVRRRRLRR
jgi:hypothetical protein